MKALNNLRKTIPNFFKNSIDSNALDLIQVIELQDNFNMMTYNALDNQYVITPVLKGNSEFETDLIESAYTKIVTEEDYKNATVNDYFSGSFEDYANLEFFEYNQLHDL